MFHKIERHVCGMLCLIVLGLMFGLGKANAQNAPGWFEANLNTNMGGVSSTPVAGFTTDKSPGFGFRAGKEVLAKGLNIYAGADFGSQSLSLTGVRLGDVSTNTFTGGLRYHIGDNEVFKPYVGIGLSYTSYDGTLSGGLRLKDNGGNVGLSATLGARVELEKTPLKNDAIHFINLGVVTHTTKAQTIETTGGAKISDAKFGGNLFFIGIGRNF